MLPYGFLSYGGPMAHIGMLEQTFVEKLKWISPQQFSELFALCQSFPGPTSTQMIIALGSMATQSALGGMLAFAIFAVPAATVLLIAGLVFRYIMNLEQQENFEMPEHVGYALQGFQSAAIAIVAQAAWKLGYKANQQPIHLMIIFLSAAIYLLFSYSVTMFILMGAGCFFNIFLEKDLKKKNNTQLLDEQTSQEQNNDIIREGRPPFGKISLIVFVCTLLFLILANLLISVEQVQYSAKFFYLGSIIVGGGHVILPLMLQNFQAYGLVDTIYWNGFSIVSALPGPLFNISIYVGAIIDGVRGAILGWVFLFAPAFMMIWGILPFWDRYRNKQTIQKGLRGVSCVSIGFILSAVYSLYVSAGEQDQTTTTLIAIGSYVALHVYECRAPLVILCGGILMVCRQVVLVQYRGLPSN
ncbi:hypothetical protein PPERSA_04143 [Pseudocohnilembus persalinus]|uniref:Chromate transporter n=1 Tax=Pseudocohnilembus persalinus TaxID=266149 RepID=A0A0V0QN54_PSEPJ|nr:hypothetical protein PPERSA_04143 [Pseudocohnilembus persalinus]|eukprot:KRX03591.1 hypothetical protein PPERSA_04143 [Pseudocohnilembus persalinus]